MKTPTKEQIEKIMNKQKDEIECGECAYCSVYGECFAAVKNTITEWEKINDVDARVEEMCKNNPGIKDFEDFNRKIRKD